MSEKINQMTITIRLRCYGTPTAREWAIEKRPLVRKELLSSSDDGRVEVEYQMQ